MTLNTSISDLTAVGRLLGEEIDPKHEEMIVSAREGVVLRENGSPRESMQKRDVEIRSDPLDVENNGEAHEGSEAESDRKKRRRRRVKGGKHHKKWKPYDKLSWTERRELEEKEGKRANQRREEAFAHGHPVAPYNTTQFLMEDHNNIDSELQIQEGLINRHNSRESNEGSVSYSESSEESFSSPEDAESEFMEKEFEETYDNIHAERLQKMSKDELIKDYIEMETKLERLQRRMERRKKKRDSSASLSSSGEEFVDVDKLRKRQENLQEELEKQKQELEKQKRKNEKLQQMLIDQENVSMDS